ncbi:MAG TPA: PAS domain S-box protein [Pirellulales bacterium]|nr:PAS domain S-box protein [Pirellulales bacterium]
MKTPQTFDLTGLPTDFALPAASAQSRDRASRRQAAVVELGRRAVAPNVHLLVQDAAALVAESLAVERFGVAELCDDRTKLEMRLAMVASPDDSPNGDARRRSVLTRQFSLDPSRSLAAYALHAGEVVTVADFSTEGRFADEWLWSQGIASAVVVPLRSHDQSYGVIGAFSPRPRQFPQDDLLYAEMIAHLVSTNIARDQTAKTLEYQRRFASTIMETVDALVLVLTPAGRIVRANSACEQMTGYSCDEVRDRAVWSALLIPGEADALKAIFVKLKSDPGPLVHEGYLLTKDAERRRIAWSFGLLSQSGGEIETILATGIDITEQRVAEEEVGRLQAAEAEQTRRLQVVLEELESQKAAASGQATAAAGTSTDDEAVGWQSDSNPFHALPRGSRTDRRRRPRRSFTYYQRIAPSENGRLPPLRMFRRVKCLDISAGGFSFLSAVRPSETDYVVALGNPPVVINVAARVMHVTPTDYEGQPAYLVGCKYTGRIDY